MEINKQYSHEGHTMTLAKKLSYGDAITEDAFVEIDGKKPTNGQVIPEAVMVMIYGLVWDTPFEEVRFSIDEFGRITQYKKNQGDKT